MSYAHFEFKAGNNKEPDLYILKLAEAIEVRQSDRLAMGNYVREHVVTRTMAGLDKEGVAFVPYSTNGPYYYYPSHGGTEKQRKAAVTRLLKRLKPDSSTPKGVSGGRRTRGGMGIRFESYADFKASLGRTNVDLTGPRAPHMLQALTVRDDPSNNGVLVGIYDMEKAKIGHGHQNGVPDRGLPKRAFLGVTESEREGLIQLLRELLANRMRGV